ncbi:hypothetical protein EHS25_006087 [Saitozyma podzolica]|uniref:Heat shock 70 kDa protein 12A n=1 Tax=Saitozyma podzolica TaxID=1890683 RepID=A0A427XTJ2_9TREE|nr:hypothetical protein EHS25_006087 [Saitozyma podzolica]
MGNCSSSGEVERNFAEKQRQRGAVPANGQPVHGANAPPAQQLYSPAAAGLYANSAPTQQTYGQQPATYNPNTGQPWSNGPGAFDPAGLPAEAIQPNTLPQGAMPPDMQLQVGSIARKAGEVLIMSYDLGTTACQCFEAPNHRLDEADGQIGFGPEVVDQWPGQTASSQGKTPSILFYNTAGQCQPDWGAQCLAHKWSPSRLASLGLTKTEWYKLHIDPATIPQEHMTGPTRQLPPGVSAFQVYTDYLQRLHVAAVARFQTRRGTDLFSRLTSQDRVQYILTIPAAWQKPSIVGELRKCAFKAGLIKDEQSTSLDFCSEPEASALECYAAATQLPLAPNDIFSVVDAGGGTVDFTTYQVLTLHPTFMMKEVDVGATRCLYRGGTFVDRSFEEFLHKKLSQEYPGVYQERHLTRGMKEFTTSTKLQFSYVNRQSSFLQLSEGDEFEQGCIELQWEEIEQCFKPHVDAIVDVAKRQVNTNAGRSKVVFCSGGFGSNDYLLDRLKAELPGIEVLQPGDKSAGSKAVSLGATRYGIFRSVQSRTSPAWYGVKAFRTLSTEDRRLAGAVAHTAIGKTGKQILDDTFSVVLPFGDSVGDDEWRSSKFSIEISDTATNTKQGKLLIYQSPRFDKPIFVDDAGVEFMCQVDVYIPPHSQGRVVVSTTGERYRAYGITVLLSLGRADLRSRVIIDGVEAGGATITWEK